MTIAQQVINVITSRCGGGKTQIVIDHLQSDVLTIFASKTVRLSMQSYEDCKKRGVNCKRIDESSVGKGKVLSTVTDLVERYNYTGVLFITHATLANLPNSVLNKAVVIVDEIPQDLAKCLCLSVLDRNAPAIFNTWFNKLPCPHMNYQLVELKEEYRAEALSLANAIRKGVETSYSSIVADILEFLINKTHAVLYTTVTTTKKHGVKHLFQAVQYSPLERVAANATSLTILAANIKDSLFGFIAEQVLDYSLIKVNAGLETKHKNKVTIIPFLKSGKWSATLKNKPVCEALNEASKTSNLTVCQEIQLFSERLLKEDFLLFKNENDDVCINTSKVDVLSTQVHGINSYRHINKASFIGSLNIDPFETKLLRMFAIDNDIELNLVDMVTTGRCYESAYQCLARTGIRNQYVKGDATEYTFIVPDMKYAKYIESWFEAGCVTIDTSHSFTVAKPKVSQEALAKKEDRGLTRLQLAVAILTDKKNKVGKMSDILKSHGVSNVTFCAYKKEFESELTVMGLLKPKKK